MTLLYKDDTMTIKLGVFENLDPTKKLSLEDTIKIIKTGRKNQIYKKNTRTTWLDKCEIQCNACGYITPVSTPGEWIWEALISNYSDDNYRALCSDCYNDYKILAGWRYNIWCC